MPYKPLSALISGSLAKLGSCTGTSGQYLFSATMFLFDREIALEIDTLASLTDVKVEIM